MHLRQPLFKKTAIINIDLSHTAHPNLLQNLKIHNKYFYSSKIIHYCKRTPLKIPKYFDISTTPCNFLPKYRVDLENLGLESQVGKIENKGFLEGGVKKIQFKRLQNQYQVNYSQNILASGASYCLELNYGNNATSAASFVIVIMTRAKRVL